MNRRAFLAGAATGATAAGLLGAGALALQQWQLVGDEVLPRVAAPSPEPGPPPPPKGRLSFSQQGEDLIFYNLLHYDLKIDNPSYLDIGAADPILSSNTFLLYWAGSRGVLVEPNPTYVRKLRAVRPRDVVLPVGIGVDAADSADYYVIRDQPPLNTFSPEVVEKLKQREGPDIVERVLRMPLVSVNQVIDEHFGTAPDLLSIDIEGMDLAVLGTLDFRRHRPAVICAETKSPADTHDSTGVARLLRARGYVACAGSLYNTIFVDRARLA
jgi:FkbM family methyltransferase